MYGSRGGKWPIARLPQPEIRPAPSKFRARQRLASGAERHNSQDQPALALNNSAGDNGRQWQLPLSPRNIGQLNELATLSETHDIPHRPNSVLPWATR